MNQINTWIYLKSTPQNNNISILCTCNTFKNGELGGPNLTHVIYNNPVNQEIPVYYFQYFNITHFTLQAVYPEEMYKAMVGGSTFLKIYKDVKAGWGVMTEAILTFIIVLTFLHSVVDKKSQIAPLSVGFSVASCFSVG